jgi:hypothetical protein
VAQGVGPEFMPWYCKKRKKERKKERKSKKAIKLKEKGELVRGVKEFTTVWEKQSTWEGVVVL